MRFTLALLLVAQVAAADVSVVVLGARVDKGRRELASTLTQLALDALSRDPTLHALDDDDLAASIDAAARKQLKGCDDDTACIVEVGGAIGADYFLLSNLGVLGKSYVYGMRLLNAKNGQIVVRVSRQVPREDDALGPVVCPLVQELLEAATKKDRRLSFDPARCRAAPVVKVASPPPEPEQPAPEPIEPRPEGKAFRVLDEDDAVRSIVPARPLLMLGLRGDRDLTASGGALAATLVVGDRLGAALSIASNLNVVGVRIEGRLALPDGDTRGYLTGGATLLSGAFGGRVSGGVEHTFEHVRVFADVAWELYSSSARETLANPILVGAGAGWVF